jgi:hypothetical protein
MITMAVAINRREPGQEKMLVTPEMAKEWLRANDKNRNLRANIVADFARDMLGEVWEYNGETISFSWDGFLLDGQHRLTALVLAGKTTPDVFIEVLVVFGLDPATQMTMDRGVKRNPADFLKLEGYENAPLLAAITKRLWSWERDDDRFVGNAKPTNAEYKKLLDERDEIQRSAEIALQVYRKFKFVPKSIVGTAYCLFLPLNMERAPEFFARLEDGANMDTDHPIMAARNRFMDEARDKGRQTAGWLQLGYLIRAWNAYVSGNALKTIVLSAKDDMPRPKAGKLVSTQDAGEK